MAWIWTSGTSWKAALLSSCIGWRTRTRRQIGREDMHQTLWGRRPLGSGGELSLQQGRSRPGLVDFWSSASMHSLARRFCAVLSAPRALHGHANWPWQIGYREC